MLLVTKFDALEQYLEERRYYDDPDLQKMVTQLGIEVDEAEESINDMESWLEEGPRPPYGGFFV